MMEKKYKIQVCGTNVCVMDIDYTTPLPMFAEKIPTSCVVRAVKLGTGSEMTFYDHSFALALASGIRNLIPECRIEVVETWKHKVSP